MGAAESSGAQRARPPAAEIERLYREVGPKLHQFIRRQVSEPAIAADLLQDVFVRLMRAGVQQRSDGEMRSYLYRTATSVIADHYRVGRIRRTVPFVPDEDAGHAPQLQVRDADAVGARELKSQVERGFGELGARDRTLLWLAYVEEMSHGDIGTTVGVGTASVKVLLSRARARLAAALTAAGLPAEETS